MSLINCQMTGILSNTLNLQRNKRATNKPLHTDNCRCKIKMANEEESGGYRWLNQYERTWYVQCDILIFITALFLRIMCICIYVRTSQALAVIFFEVHARDYLVCAKLCMASPVFFLCLISALFSQPINYLARFTTLKFPSCLTDKSILREAKTE